MRDIERQFPNITQFLQLGVTAEGRDIFGIRIVDEVHLEQEELPIIFVTGAAIARDWISAMSAVNLIHMLSEHYSIYREIVDDLEWFIVPVANPDGYEFSRTEGVSCIL
jgi:murein tripeptide amidase MpaA